MKFADILEIMRQESLSEREKGTKFEKLVRKWLKTDSRYSEIDEVWLWGDIAEALGREKKDLGIDLVARTKGDEYWAIQCKFYDKETTIDMPAVANFIAASDRNIKDFRNEDKPTQFAARIWVSTTEKWNANAEITIKDGSIPFIKIGLATFESSDVDWESLFFGKETVKRAKTPFDHQKEALVKAHEHYATHDRGKLIMACGCGKSYTSLIAVEQETGGKGCVLFLVPSIALLNQTLNCWMSDTKSKMRAICICSDPKASNKKKKSDDAEDSVTDLALPATTNSNAVLERFLKYRNDDTLLVVFSTYQSIEAVHEAQESICKVIGDKGVFDWIVCDEAHRTTGIKFAGQDESAFTRIHDNDYIRGKKRLYMTATPRVYGDAVQAKAKQVDGILCSMDDTAIYGEEFYRVGFAYAVQHGLLTDYKVLVLTVGSENDLPSDLRDEVAKAEKPELNFDFVTRIYGCINALSKNIVGDNNITWNTDPRLMRRALAFCPNIDKKGDVTSSTNTALQFPIISEGIRNHLDAEQQSKMVKVTAMHIDGSMDSNKRAEKLSWLEADSDDPNECRVLCNVRCLSEGVDVPALDAVIFMSPRGSQIEVVQSVGRVMRNFRKGSPDEKKYGYIIIPVVVNPNVSPEEALNKNESFKTVWSVLNALRSHDENFNALVNSIALNKNKPFKIVVGGVPQMGGMTVSRQDEDEARRLEIQERLVTQQKLFEETREAIFAKMVEKVGDTLYWEKWAKEVGVVAKNFIGRIQELVSQDGKHKEEFKKFVTSLQSCLNSQVKEKDAIEMLAQHLITRPVFEALFKDYKFTQNNAVTQSMEGMIKLLIDAGMEKDTAVLDKFYDSVRTNLGNIDNLQGRQTVIKNLYEKFFKGAFPETVGKLGVVYTPVECVDFIIHSVNDVLKKEFDCSLTDEGVHILDPFTGTGTFITRLLQSGLIRQEDMERKYLNEIHCNEIIPLAYYVADVNIENVFHDIMKRDEYLNFDNICLTDTFEHAEDTSMQLKMEFEALNKNAEGIERQKKLPIRVIIGNPPYSAGQKKANDNAQNLKYSKLDARIESTYVSMTKSTNKNSIYDSYIRAFRWASDRIERPHSGKQLGGVIGFITNGKWLDGNAAAGFRKCLEQEFTSIYVFDLRGDHYAIGELARKEGGQIFGEGSRAPVVITILVYHPEKTGKAEIHYCDIGDYLKREEKLDILRNRKSISSSEISWEILEPNEYGDWINLRSDLFGSFVIIGDKHDKSLKEEFFNKVYSNGLKTQRDAWCWNFSKKNLAYNIKNAITFYNSQVDDDDLSEDKILYDRKKFSWTRATINSCLKKKRFNFDEKCFVVGCYRPFIRQNIYFSRQLNEMVYQIPKLFPDKKLNNLVICVHGTGGKKDFSAIVTNVLPDLNLLDAGTQCFPLYYYTEKDLVQISMLDNNKEQYERKDSITDWILRAVRSRFQGTKAITKETIFYYVYGILYSQDYCVKFKDDLKKSLPRIPIVDDVTTFMEFSKRGKELADLHLNYESAPAWADVIVKGAERSNFLVEKMRFAKNGKEDDLSTIIYNSDITISNIPTEAYEYIVNGKSAIGWILDQYRIKTDEDSGITNDPNDWAKEQGKPRYILDLLLSIITVSMETMKIVKALPKLTFDESNADDAIDLNNMSVQGE